jgi:hypothetical protein
LSHSNPILAQWIVQVVIPHGGYLTLAQKKNCAAVALPPAKWSGVMPPHPGCFGGTDFDVTFVASRSHQARGATAASLKHDAMTQTPVAVLPFMASPDKREANFLGTEARVSPMIFRVRLPFASSRIRLAWSRPSAYSAD